jgi:hypothetical protein
MRALACFQAEDDVPDECLCSLLVSAGNTIEQWINPFWGTFTISGFWTYVERSLNHGLLIPFMCETRTILIYFLDPKPEVLHKSKELPNTRVLWLLLSSFPPLLAAFPLCCNIQIKSFTYCPRVKMSTHGEANCLQNDKLNFSDSFLRVSIGRIMHNIWLSLDSSS